MHYDKQSAKIHLLYIWKFALHEFVFVTAKNLVRTDVCGSCPSDFFLKCVQLLNNENFIEDILYREN